MSKLSEKISYLRGLAEGMNLDTSKNEGKLLSEVIDALELAAKQINYVEESLEDLSDYVEDIDSDLAEVEEYIVDEEDDEDDNCCDHDYYDDEYDEDDSELVYECPHCGKEVVLDSEEIDMDFDPKCTECGNSLFGDDDDDEY
ncbi:MAG: hypothetical protein GYA87_04910, partial [Christensenellaceae bacterium]|nr:hypothetical protein [Christensenellaceae bacterium]